MYWGNHVLSTPIWSQDCTVWYFVPDNYYFEFDHGQVTKHVGICHITPLTLQSQFNS